MSTRSRSGRDWSGSGHTQINLVMTKIHVAHEAISYNRVSFSGSNIQLSSSKDATFLRRL